MRRTWSASTTTIVVSRGLCANLSILPQGHELSSGGSSTCVTVLRSEHCGTFTVMIRSERWLFHLIQVCIGLTKHCNPSQLATKRNIRQRLLDSEPTFLVRKGHCASSGRTGDVVLSVFDVDLLAVRTKSSQFWVCSSLTTLLDHQPRCYQNYYCSFSGWRIGEAVITPAAYTSPDT